MIRVLLADDHHLFRTGVRYMLASCAHIEVVGEAADGLTAVELARTLRPDVAILDILMPDLNGLEAVQRLPEGVKTLILSMNDSEEYILKALRVGAYGYMLKTANREELVDAIMKVAAGKQYMSSPANGRGLESYLERVGNHETSFDRLSSRQRQVLQMLVEGRNTKDIARRLGLAAKTIEMYRTQLMEALGIHDLTGLLRYAIKMGIVEVR